MRGYHVYRDLIEVLGGYFSSIYVLNEYLAIDLFNITGYFGLLFSW